LWSHVHSIQCVHESLVGNKHYLILQIWKVPDLILTPKVVCPDWGSSWPF
jgi:hypothetical protein